MELPELKGYLRKKSRQGRWQRRYFEATTHYLTYYKNRESEKLLACIDLWRTQSISGNENDPDHLEFSIQIGDQSYLLRADAPEETTKWVEGLQARQTRPENAPSETFSHPASERFDGGESDTSSDISARRMGGGGYTSSDAGSIGSTAKSRAFQQPRLSYTESPMNGIVPNANAMAASPYPMVNANQQVRYAADPDEAKLGGCCVPCRPM